MKTLSILLPTCLAVITCSQAHATLSALNFFNVITINDYTLNNETEGSAFVGGDYIPSDTSRFGFNLGQANDLDNRLWLNNGVTGNSSTALITGSLISRTDNISSSQYTLNGNGTNDPTVATGEAAWSQALINNFGLNSTSAFTTSLLQTSTFWSALESNSTGSTPGNGSFTFNAAPQTINGEELAIFNVDGNDLFGANNSGPNFDRLELNVNGAETILINVSGTMFDLNRNFSNGFTNNEENIVFNFYEATELTVTSNFRGTLFAPLATIEQNSNIDGTVVANNLEQNNEVHALTFEGSIPGPFDSIPEPSSAMLLSLSSLALLRRRRNNP